MERIVLGMNDKKAKETDDVARPRRSYEPPQIIRRQQVLASTLVSGEQCVFDPPLPGGGCP